MAYSARTDLEDIYGVNNIKLWADVNNNQDSATIAARITWSITQSDAMINAELRRGPYTIPFTEPPPQIIIDLSARLAGVYLYDSRGIVDNNPEDDQLADHRKMVKDTIADIHAGRTRLPGLTSAINYPIALIEEE